MPTDWVGLSAAAPWRQSATTTSGNHQAPPQLLSLPNEVRPRKGPLTRAR